MSGRSERAKRRASVRVEQQFAKDTEKAKQVSLDHLDYDKINHEEQELMLMPGVGWITITKK